MNEKSAVEKITSSLATKTGANAVAAFGATITPLAAFIPFLIDALASGRQSQRLEETLQEINSLVKANQEAARNMTDDQYKVVSESISAAFYTVSEKKHEALRTAVKNAVTNNVIVNGVSDALSRLIRDISPAEIDFVVRNFQHEQIALWTEEVGPTENIKVQLFEPNSSDEVCISGLINIGLLYPKKSSWDVICYEWSPLTAKLLALFTKA